MKFIVGIGNPGTKYDGTRHNIGFRALDALRSQLEKERGKRLVVSKEFQAETAVVSDEVLLVKPQTYVNRTGESAISLLSGYNASPADFLFVCDDVNLAFGKLRLRGSGSAGGHHGLESVIASFGSEDFARLRIGVGGGELPEDLTGYVLEPFSGPEQAELDGILNDAVAVCREWTEKGLKAATDRLSRLKSNQQESQNE